jgi:hypothetical protein
MHSLLALGVCASRQRCVRSAPNSFYRSNSRVSVFECSHVRAFERPRVSALAHTDLSRVRVRARLCFGALARSPCCVRPFCTSSVRMPMRLSVSRVREFRLFACRMLTRSIVSRVAFSRFCAFALSRIRVSNAHTFKRFADRVFAFSRSPFACSDAHAFERFVHSCIRVFHASRSRLIGLRRRSQSRGLRLGLGPIFRRFGPGHAASARHVVYVSLHKSPRLDSLSPGRCYVR